MTNVDHSNSVPRMAKIADPLSQAEIEDALIVNPCVFAMSIDFTAKEIKI